MQTLLISAHKIDPCQVSMLIYPGTDHQWARACIEDYVVSEAQFQYLKKLWQSLPVTCVVDNDNEGDYVNQNVKSTNSMKGQTGTIVSATYTLVSMKNLILTISIILLWGWEKCAENARGLCRGCTDGFGIVHHICIESSYTNPINSKPPSACLISQLWKTRWHPTASCRFVTCW